MIFFACLSRTKYSLAESIRAAFTPLGIVPETNVAALRKV